MANKGNIVGETRMMNCGMNATCIAYRNYYDIDVQFEDGTVVLNKKKECFIRGAIQNPNLPKRISEEKRIANLKRNIEKSSCLGIIKMMNCGMNATCIAYRKSNDIDIRFEDGLVLKHKMKSDFMKGLISHPNLKYKINSDNIITKARDKILNTVVFQDCCNQNATCIIYRGAKDLDVQFEDGTIVEHRTRYDFVNGKICNPKIKGKKRIEDNKNDLLNVSIVQNNGMLATCVAYRGRHDIDVQFEDGTIIEHKQKWEFLNGRVGNPNWWQKSFPQRIIYECILNYFPNSIFNYRPDFMKNTSTGLNMEIDIWIPELAVGIEYDGYPWHKEETDTSQKKYNLFVNSKEVNKIYTFIEKDCIVHNSNKHINYFLSNNKSLLDYSELERYISILLNQLGVNDSIELTDTYMNEIRKKCGNQLLGMTIKQNCGMEATCIAYRGSHDLDIQFEDGIIVTHRTKNNFEKGLLGHPSVNMNSFNRIKNKEKDLLNKTVKQNCGMEATCIAYRGNADIDVKFSDGTIAQHKTKSAFLNGSIRNPNINRIGRYESENVGLEKVMNCGMKCKIIRYRKSNDIDVQFEDGTIVEHKQMSSFTRGQIMNPNIKKGHGEIKIIQCDLDGKVLREFDSIADAQEYLGMPRNKISSIYDCFKQNSKKNNAYGYIWKKR